MTFLQAISISLIASFLALFCISKDSSNSSTGLKGFLIDSLEWIVIYIALAISILIPIYSLVNFFRYAFHL